MKGVCRRSWFRVLFPMELLPSWCNKLDSTFETEDAKSVRQSWQMIEWVSGIREPVDGFRRSSVSKRQLFVVQLLTR